MEQYKFEEHVHNFSVWTSARAVSRNFTTTISIKKAIECTDIFDFSHSKYEYSQIEFDDLHRIWANKMMDSLINSNAKNVSYGRAAKIISIYLKTSVILSSKGSCNKSLIIHPPIDAILLENILLNNPYLTYLKNIKWTQLDEEKYWKLVTNLRRDLKEFDWRIESYWSPK